MATKPRSPALKKQAQDKLTSEAIEQHTKAFLKAGGHIQHIKSGVSGQSNLPGPRQIVLSKK